MSDPRLPRGGRDLGPVAELAARIEVLLRRYRIPAQEARAILEEILPLLSLRWGDTDNPQFWLLKTLQKRCRRYWRDLRQPLFESADRSLAAWLGDPDVSTEQRERRRQILAELVARLPRGCRQELANRYHLARTASRVVRGPFWVISGMDDGTRRCLAALLRQIVQRVVDLRTPS